MLAISVVFALCMMRPPLDGPQNDIEGRYRHLKQEIISEGKLKAAPWNDFRKFAPQFLGLVAEAPDDPSSLAAVLTVAEYGSRLLDTCSYDGESHGRMMGQALDLLVGERLNDERVGGLCLVLSRLPSPARESFLRRAFRDSTNPSVRGRASLALAELLTTKLKCVESLSGPMPADVRSRAEQTWGVEYLGELQRSDRAELRKEAESLYERVVTDFPKIPFVQGTSETPLYSATAAKDLAAGKTLRMISEANLDMLRHLAEGSIAPEIEGRDAQDVPFKLSDYRGKVVLLTFSGNWCGPCRSMYPYERELVARLKGRPFALLSVNTDKEVATLKESMRDGEVTWRCWWDGTPTGPICSRWNIRAWPTIYVLDAQGVIRAKDPRDESLDKLINGLLGEIDPAE